MENYAGAPWDTVLGDLLGKPSWRRAPGHPFWVTALECDPGGYPLENRPGGPRWRTTLVALASPSSSRGASSGTPLATGSRRSCWEIAGKHLWGTSMGNHPGGPPRESAPGNSLGNNSEGLAWETALGGELLWKTALGGRPERLLWARTSPSWGIAGENRSGGFSGNRSEGPLWKTALGGLLGKPF